MNLLASTLAVFDQRNSEDPNIEIIDNVKTPKELLYSQRMSAQLAAFAPNASEVLQLAARAQHIQRWTIARSEYPEGRRGYKQWRVRLGEFHAQTASKIMAEQGFDAKQCHRITELLQKKNLKSDDEVQCLEDVICLVFIQFYLLDFVEKHQNDYSQEKLFAIVKKTWAKMSAKGQQAALQLPLEQNLLAIIKLALGIPA